MQLWFSVLIAIREIPLQLLRIAFPVTRLNTMVQKIMLLRSSQPIARCATIQTTGSIRISTTLWQISLWPVLTFLLNVQVATQRVMQGLLLNVKAAIRQNIILYRCQAILQPEYLSNAKPATRLPTGNPHHSIILQLDLHWLVATRQLCSVHRVI